MKGEVHPTVQLRQDTKEMMPLKQLPMHQPMLLKRMHWPMLRRQKSTLAGGSAAGCIWRR
jgi:hypothetical protein